MRTKGAVKGIDHVIGRGGGGWVSGSAGSAGMLLDLIEAELSHAELSSADRDRPPRSWAERTKIVSWEILYHRLTQWWYVGQLFWGQRPKGSKIDCFEMYWGVKFLQHYTQFSCILPHKLQHQCNCCSLPARVLLEHKPSNLPSNLRFLTARIESYQFQKIPEIRAGGRGGWVGLRMGPNGGGADDTVNALDRSLI